MEPIVLAQLAVLSVTLAVISIVDFGTQTIPDAATAALAVAGLAFEVMHSFEVLPWVVASGSIYFLLFWAIRQGHWRLTGRVGMGFGDVKLAGAAGLWLTPALLPAFVGIAAGIALMSVAAVAVCAGAGVLSRRIPFGPFLALSLLTCWLLKTSNFGLEALHAF